MEDDDISQELYTRNKVDASNTASEKKRNLYDAIGVEVDVKNLNYSVIVNKQTRKLLRDVTFHLEPGEMCALMGPSGAGKR